jgi:hypothetical protein
MDRYKAQPTLVRRMHALALMIAAALASVLVFVAAWRLLKTNVVIGIVVVALAPALVGLGWAGAVATWLARDRTSLRHSGEWAVLLAFPVALLGSAFDCGGFSGCTGLCGFISTWWLPVLGVVLVAYLIRAKPATLLLLTILSFALLVPHCCCDNCVNRLWIDFIGLSPACYAGSFAVGVVTAGAVASGRFVLISGIAAWLTALALVAFAVGHHQFHWPW